MKLTQLKTPRSDDCAKQCREMGLVVGNTIVGRETYATGEWSEAKLTLLWIGRHEAMWMLRRRNIGRPRWRMDGECANLTLKYRQWYLVG